MHSLHYSKIFLVGYWMVASFDPPECALSLLLLANLESKPAEQASHRCHPHMGASDKSGTLLVLDGTNSPSAHGAQVASSKRPVCKANARPTCGLYFAKVGAYLDAAGFCSAGISSR
jgi:hypothetical protein